MTHLSILFSIRNGGDISADHTVLVDAALAKAKPVDIPKDQVQNVSDYINAQLLRNGETIPLEQKAALEELLQSLVNRA